VDVDKLPNYVNIVLCDYFLWRIFFLLFFASHISGNFVLLFLSEGCSPNASRESFTIGICLWLQLRNKLEEIYNVSGLVDSISVDEYYTMKSAH